ncbi:glycosyltransferase family 2 protein [Dorea sp.]|nr:glycosyltransferase family 2 protein [uncultured Dorea sp.]
MSNGLDYINIIKKVSPYNLKKGILYLRHYGPKGFWIKLTERFQKTDIDYKEWLQEHKPSEKELEKQKNQVFAYAPKISVLVPVYNTPEEFLKQMIQSVRVQTYPNWELCIANANPANDNVRRILDICTRKDSRIKVVDVVENEGIAQNTNRALDIATGEYVGLLDHDDLLEESALYEIVKRINENEKTDVLYSDEDKVTTNLEEYFAPNFKPDFNLDMLRSNNYICHFFVAKKELVEEVGRFRAVYNGAQDYDLILRCVEKAEHIEHIAKILYHWRIHQESTADNPLSKMYAYDAGKEAIEEHLKRCQTEGEVSLTDNLGFYRVKYKISGNPLISILIPNKDQKETLDKCLRSIEKLTDYDNYEIIIIENNSTEKETFEYYNEISKKEKIRVIYWQGEFNYSAINNFGAGHARGDYLLLLNNDMEVINGDWLQEMLSHCQREEVGAVGARLYYPDDTVQHAGIIIGIGGVAGSVFVGMKRGYTGYMHRASIQQDLSAVTAACMLIKRSVFEEVGGLEEKLQIAFNDVDLCLRIRKKGYLIVYDPYVELYHYESKTRGPEDTKEKVRRFQSEIEYMRSHWISILKNGDPAYNPNLTLKKWDYSLKVN